MNPQGRALLVRSAGKVRRNDPRRPIRDAAGFCAGGEMRKAADQCSAPTRGRDRVVILRRGTRRRISTARGGYIEAFKENEPCAGGEILRLALLAQDDSERWAARSGDRALRGTHLPPLKGEVSPPPAAVTEGFPRGGLKSGLQKGYSML